MLHLAVERHWTARGEHDWSSIGAPFSRIRPASLSANTSLQEGLRAPGWGGASTDAWFACTNMSCRCPSHACSPERTTCSMSA